jgi:hypothetical protein
MPAARHPICAVLHNLADALGGSERAVSPQRVEELQHDPT